VHSLMFLIMDFPKKGIPGKKRNGHSTKLFQRRCRININENTFSHRVIDAWNDLDGCTVNCSTVATSETHVFRRYPREWRPKRSEHSNLCP